MEIQVDNNAIKAEMSAQSKLMEDFPIDKALVSDIDRHIKEIESKLNDHLVHLESHYPILHYLPSTPAAHLATVVTEDVWSSLDFVKVFPCRDCLHEEISYKKSSKGYGFFYNTGRVKYDLGICEDYGGTDTYIRIIEDSREEVKVTGASVEIKLKFFQHLKFLLQQIRDRSNNVATEYRNAIYPQ